MADSDRLGLISWIVLATVVVIPPAFGSAFTQFEFIKESLLAIFAGLGLFGWGISVLSERKVAMTGGLLAALLSAFSAFAVAAVMWAPSTQLGAVSAANWLAAGVLFLLVIAPGGRPLRFAQFALAVAVGTLLTAGLGLLDAAGTGITTGIWDPPGFAGPFDAREFAVGYYAVALPIIAAGVFRASSTARRGVTILALVLGAVHFGLCADPLAVAVVGGAAVLTTIALAVFQGFDRLSLAFGPLGALAAALVVAAGVSFGGPAPGPANDATQLPWVAELHPRPLANQVENRDPRFSIPRVEEMPNWEARSYTVGIAFDMFREQPIVGHGPGSWWGLQTKFPRSEEPFPRGIYERYPAFRAPHNGFALIMAELGGVGLILFLLWLSGLLGITVTALARKAEAENWLIEHFGLTTAIVAGIACAVFTPSLQMAGAVALIFVTAGMLARESAALNDFRGMSGVWTINKTGRRWDTTLFCGVVPVVLGLSLAALGGIWTLTTYYRSWGDLAMLRTQHELAVDKYTLADDIFGGDGDLLFDLALARKRLGRSKEAQGDVNRAALLRPYDVRIINLIAELHMADREYADATTAARRAVALFPNYIEGRRILGAALNLQGRMTDAAAELLEILKLDPPDALKGQIHKELAVYYEGPLDNPAKAVEHYKLAIQLMDKGFLTENIRVSLEEMEKEVERRRLEREGKPIPPELMPQQLPSGLSPDDGHGHGHDH